MKRSILIVLLFTASLSFAKKDQPQKLAEKWLELGEQKILVEIADYPKARRKGLMFRKSMKENHGMLFIFEKSEKLSFWMKNTYIPLDIGYFDENKRLIEVHQMEPHSLEPVECSRKALYALEMNIGWFEKKKVKAGMQFAYFKPKK